MVPQQKFEVKISKYEVVAAMAPTKEHWLPQSNLDLLLPPIDVHVIFCYEKPSSGYTFALMVGVLKEALAQTLVSYYVLAGEMVQNVAGEPELLCNSRGVDFAEAFANIELRELNLYNPDESIEGKLVLKKKQGVLAIQAKKFKCGGLVVGCTFDHRVADAYSANMFLVSWAEIAQSKPISIQPSFRRSLISPRRPSRPDSLVQELYTLLNFISPSPHEETSGIDHQKRLSRIYYVKAEEIQHLQLLANYDNDSQECNRKTKFEAFSAFVWKIIAFGTGDEVDKRSRLGIVVDGRTRLDDGDENRSKTISYFGNVVAIPSWKMKNNELKEKPLSFVANEVHKFLKGAATKEFFQGLIDYVEAHRPQPAAPKIVISKVTKEEPAVVVSSGQRFPVGKIDFGWGKPAFGSYHFPWGQQSGYVMPMPSASGNGDWVVYVNLSKDQIELVEKNADHVLKPMTREHLFSI